MEDLGQQKTLLLVEDEELNRAAIKRVLYDLDLVFLEAENGQQALEILAEQSVDLILLDLVMPVMDGFAFLEHYQAMENSHVAQANTPVCIMSAWFDDDNRRRAVELGAIDFVGKPVDNIELMVRVRSLLRFSTYRQRSEVLQNLLENRPAEQGGNNAQDVKALLAKVNELQQIQRRQEIWSEAQVWIIEAQGSLTDTNNLARFYQGVVHHAMLMTHARHGACVLFNDSGELQEIISPSIANSKFPQLACIEDGERALYKLLAQETPLRVEEPEACPGCELGSQDCPARNSLLLMPLLLNGRLVGALLMSDKVGAKAFCDQDESLLHLFAIQVAGVLEGKELLHTLHKNNTELHAEQAEQRALIRRLHEAQDQLLQSEKMASIGQLAAGVAHEINNPVGFVNSNLGTLQKYVQQLLELLDTYEQAELLLDDATLSKIQLARQQADIEFLKQDVLALVQESHQGLTRVMQIVQDLKDFSHVDEGEWQLVDLHQGLDSTLNIVNNELKYKAQVIKEYGQLPLTECIGPQLNQVFMNLLVNAAHAMEQHGVITIRTGAEQDWVWVEISDTGKGITPEHLKRIFDPFFTTKPVGAGTGLGLSMSYGIVEKHGGRIEVHSEVGEGATFRLWLPERQDEERMEAAG